MKVFLNMLKNKNYQFMFVLFLVILCLPLIHKLLNKSIDIENFQATSAASAVASGTSNPDEVKYGDIVQINLTISSQVPRYKDYNILTAGVGMNGNIETYHHNKDRNQMIYGYKPNNELSQLW